MQNSGCRQMYVVNNAKFRAQADVRIIYTRIINNAKYRVQAGQVEKNTYPLFLVEGNKKLQMVSIFYFCGVHVFFFFYQRCLSVTEQ
jgi:hypothetical protein